MARGIRVRAECDEHPDAEIRIVGHHVTARQKRIKHDDGTETKYIAGEFVIKLQCPICEYLFLLTVDNLEAKSLLE